MDENEVYARFVRVCRKKKGIRRVDLPDMVNISHARLVLIENGLIDVEAIPAALTARFEEVFGLKLADFITLTEDVDQDKDDL